MRDDMQHRDGRDNRDSNNSPGGAESAGSHASSEEAFRQLAAERLKSLQDGTSQPVSFDEFRTRMYEIPGVRERDDAYIEMRDRVYTRFGIAFSASSLSVEEVAREAGVSSMTVASLLDRRGFPTRATIGKIAAVFGKQASDFFDAET